MSYKETYDLVTHTWIELHNTLVAMDRGDAEGAQLIVETLMKRYDRIVDEQTEGPEPPDDPQTAEEGRDK